MYLWFSFLSLLPVVFCRICLYIDLRVSLLRLHHQFYSCCVVFDVLFSSFFRRLCIKKTATEIRWVREMTRQGIPLSLAHVLIIELIRI